MHEVGKVAFLGVFFEDIVRGLILKVICWFSDVNSDGVSDLI